MHRSSLASLAAIVAGIVGLIAAASGIGEPRQRNVATAALASLTAPPEPTTESSQVTTIHATTVSSSTTTTTTTSTRTVAPPSTAAPATAAATPTARAARPRPVTAVSRPVVILYGDSLAWEAGDAFAFALAARPDVVVHQRSFGGTAICDWLPAMRDDLVALRPGVVIVQFSGNNFTTCMHDADGAALVGNALVERYRADALTVAATFEGRDVAVVFAGTPLPRSHSDESPSIVDRVNEVYRDVAARSEIADYADAGAALLVDGAWTATLPCLPAEPCDGADGRNVVRAPDGLHFCPVGGRADGGVTAVCPVWSSGAFRFGAALARPVLDRWNGSHMRPATDAR